MEKGGLKVCLSLLLLVLNFTAVSGTPCGLEPLDLSVKQCVIKQESDPVKRDYLQRILESARFKTTLFEEIRSFENPPRKVRYALPEFTTVLRFNKPAIDAEISNMGTSLINQYQDNCNSLVDDYIDGSVNRAYSRVRNGVLELIMDAEVNAGACVSYIRCSKAYKRVWGVKVPYPRCAKAHKKVELIDGYINQSSQKRVIPLDNSFSNCGKMKKELTDSDSHMVDNVGSYSHLEACDLTIDKRDLNFSDLEKFIADLFNFAVAPIMLAFQTNLYEKSLRQRLNDVIEDVNSALKRSAVSENDIEMMNEALIGISDGDNRKEIIKKMIGLTWDNAMFSEQSLFCEDVMIEPDKPFSAPKKTCSYKNIYKIEGSEIVQQNIRRASYEGMKEQDAKTLGAFIDTGNVISPSCASYKLLFRSMEKYYENGCVTSEPTDKNVIVEEGTTLYNIAKSEYGDGGYYLPLSSYNKLTNWNLLQPSQVIKVPSLKRLLSTGIIIKSGQTISEVLGEKVFDESYMEEFSKINPHIVDIDEIYPFQVINFHEKN